MAGLMLGPEALASDSHGGILLVVVRGGRVPVVIIEEGVVLVEGLGLLHVLGVVELIVHGSWASHVFDGREVRLFDLCLAVSRLEENPVRFFLRRADLLLHARQDLHHGVVVLVDVAFVERFVRRIFKGVVGVRRLSRGRPSLRARAS